MKNITSKTTFTAIAALFFATSLYATDMKSNEMSMAKDSMPMTKDAMPMQNDKMASDGMMKSHDMKSHDMTMDNMKSEGMKSDDMKTKEMKNLTAVFVSKRDYCLRHVVPLGPSSNTIPIAVSSLRAESAAAQSLAARASLRCLMSASIFATSSSSEPACKNFSGSC